MSTRSAMPTAPTRSTVRHMQPNALVAMTDIYRGKFAIFDSPYAIGALSAAFESKTAARVALPGFKKACPTAIVGYCMTEQEEATRREDREAQLKDALRTVFPDGPEGDLATKVMLNLIVVNDGLDAEGWAGIKPPVTDEHEEFKAAHRAETAAQRKALCKLRSQLEKLPGFIDAARNSLEPLDVQVNDCPKTNTYLESMWCVKVMIHSVDRALQQARPNRDTLWHLAVSMRTCLEMADANLGATLSGDWAKAVRIMLSFLYPYSDVEDVRDKFRSIKVRWARDQKTTRTRASG